jgi:probable HAF family extracellular repeat protein
MAINDLGQVVGVADDQAFVWTPESGVDLIVDLVAESLLAEAGFLPPETYYWWRSGSVAYSVNSSGRIVGTVYNNSRHFLFDLNHGQIYLGDIQDCQELMNEGMNHYSVGGAYDINDKGEVVGTAQVNEDLRDSLGYRIFRRHAFRWSAETGMVDLGTVDEAGESSALAINEAGATVGWADSGSDRLACLWRPEEPIQLLKPFDSRQSLASDINESGQIVGTYEIFEGGYHTQTRSFVWGEQRGAMDLAPIPTPPFIEDAAWDRIQVQAINDNGWIVGGCNMWHGPAPAWPEIVPDRAFIFRDGHMSDLNDLVPAGSGLIITRATDINNHGQIAACGYTRSTDPEVGFATGRVVLLTPIGPSEDLDEDTVLDTWDNCINASNPDQLDSDTDGVGNACDNCLTAPNADQADWDDDGEGDVCDDDDDGDDVADGFDNCLLAANPDQADYDGNGIGDACERRLPYMPVYFPCGFGLAQCCPICLSFLAGARFVNARQRRKES